MLKVLSTILVLVTVSCGQGFESNSETSPDVNADLAKDQAPKDINVTAKFYAKESELPECTTELFRLLAYVKELDQFFYCDKDWAALDLKGPKGDNGSDGKDGLSGKGTDGLAGKDGTNGNNGTDGVIGRDGRDGRDGQDGETGSDSEWISPISGDQFILVSATPAEVADEYPCPIGSTKPTESEVAGAYSHFEKAFFYDGCINTTCQVGLQTPGARYLSVSDDRGFNQWRPISEFSVRPFPPFICKITQ